MGKIVDVVVRFIRMLSEPNLLIREVSRRTWKVADVRTILAMFKLFIAVHFAILNRITDRWFWV